MAKPDFNLDEFSEAMQSSTKSKDEPQTSQLNEPKNNSEKDITLSLKVKLTFDELKSLNSLAMMETRKKGKRVTVTGLLIDQVKKLVKKGDKADE